ncbi:MAG: hypothetical protein IKF06_02525, partial [Lachnospiraceae bacterium]|nr:hypothetical protein [Lachnospiraceae bacterium]
ISAIVKNSDGEITYYGRIAKASSADDASVTINTSGKVGDGDKLYVFYEQFNGDKTGETGAKTDYASDLQEVPLANGSHDWEFKGFEWTGDETNGYTKAVANYVCENDSTHTDTVDATITEAVTDPTTTTTGKTTYSATVPSDKSLDGQPHDATNTENAEKEAKVTDMIAYTFTEGDGSTWTKGSSDNLDATVKRSVDDDTTFARCEKITVDGKTELTDADCTKAEGSLKLSLKPGFLEKLSEGKHTLVVTFDDGDSPEMTFTIEAKAEEETKSDTSPTTGDHNNAGLWAAIMSGALLAVILLILAGRKYLKKQR